MQALHGSMAALDDGSGTVIPSFLPSDLANLALWLKADALVLNDGDAVSTWTDSSTNGRNATQAGAATLKPTYKTNIVNGKPVVRFDGGDSLTFTSLALTDLAIFIVGKRATNAAILMAIGNAASPGYANVSHYSDDSLYFTNDAGSYIFSAASNTATWDVYTYQRSGTSASARRNGAAAITPAALTGNITLSMVGGRYGDKTTGDIAEVIVYSAALSDTDRGSVQTYLATKYGITLA